MHIEPLGACLGDGRDGHASQHLLQPAHMLRLVAHFLGQQAAQLRQYAIHSTSLVLVQPALELAPLPGLGFGLSWGYAEDTH